MRAYQLTDQTNERMNDLWGSTSTEQTVARMSEGKKTNLLSYIRAPATTSRHRFVFIVFHICVFFFLNSFFLLLYICKICHTQFNMLPVQFSDQNWKWTNERMNQSKTHRLNINFFVFNINCTRISNSEVYVTLFRFLFRWAFTAEPFRFHKCANIDGTNQWTKENKTKRRMEKKANWISRV